jgi:hypothetical protein
MKRQKEIKLNEFQLNVLLSGELQEVAAELMGTSTGHLSIRIPAT